MTVRFWQNSRPLGWVALRALLGVGWGLLRTAFTLRVMGRSGSETADT